MFNNTRDYLLLRLLNSKVLEPCFRLSLRAAGDREHRRKVHSHRKGTKLLDSESSYQLGSVSEIGRQSWPKQSTVGIVNSKTFFKHLQRFFDTEVVRKLPEHYDSQMF